MSNVENLSPQVLRGAAREVRRLAANPPPGVKLALRDNDFTEIVALIEGPAGTPYAEGVFRVKLTLGREFPAAPPRATFLTKIFHPNVSTAGEVCVNTLKKDWRPELGLSHVLLAIKCLLIAPNPESALNAEAGALLLEHYDDYFRRAKLLTDIHARSSVAPAALHEVSTGDDGVHSSKSASNGNQEGTSVSESTRVEGPSAKRERRAGGAGAGTRDKRRILKRL